MIKVIPTLIIVSFFQLSVIYAQIVGIALCGSVSVDQPPIALGGQLYSDFETKKSSLFLSAKYLHSNYSDERITSIVNYNRLDVNGNYLRSLQIDYQKIQLKIGPGLGYQWIKHNAHGVHINWYHVSETHYLNISLLAMLSIIKLKPLHFDLLVMPSYSINFSTWVEPIGYKPTKNNNLFFT